ncbi:alpha/beta hydrolase-fold protein [Chitinophaga filiformis]|uniref:Predicted hydrolase of the alpha/beta superfamily n=1 Tax=Chitinophaga filiformis TaxID=104663 RepID=A0A1G7U2F8_CHIFI|nr:alpha/beta hydrolase-fold protein [Chitinophaga filiformis]SDG41785.1 Predicted hydrolase of the alpha/beta superfamily [Chitinophaga filiformis]
MKHIITAFLVLSFLTASAQEIVRDSIYSNVLKEQRKIEVVMPDNYKPGERFEVTYVTDGEWNTKIVAQLQRFAQIQFMPPNIIVSLPNTYVNKDNYRVRDFTPYKIPDNKLTGGADDFLSFLKTELIPYIEKKYPTKGFRTYYGGSLGGVFGLYTFFKEPTLFQSYLLADPAFWWGNGFLMKMAGDSLPSLPNPERTLLFTGREGQALKGMGIKDMDSIFHAKAPAALHWKTLVYSGETHNSMIFKTVYDGLKYTYNGYMTKELNYHPMSGIILKDKPFSLYCFPEEHLDVHYTTDGTEPTAASPKLTAGETKITVPVQLTVKVFTARDGYAQTKKGTFVAGEMWHGIDKPKKVLPGGLDTLNGKVTGFIELKEPGYYIFGIESGTDATFSLNKQVLIDYKAKADDDDAQSYIVPLDKGFYQFDMTYNAAAKIPSLMYLGPGKEEPTPIPAALQYHTGTGNHKK